MGKRLPSQSRVQSFSEGFSDLSNPLHVCSDMIHSAIKVFL